jgi:hypothetical protein
VENPREGLLCPRKVLRRHENLSLTEDSLIEELDGPGNGGVVGSLSAGVLKGQENQDTETHQ